MAPGGRRSSSPPPTRAPTATSRACSGKYVREEKLIPPRGGDPPADGPARRQPGARGPRPAEAKGMFADVVVFDPATIADRATFEKPHQYAVGVRHVLVNGVPVLKDGEHTGALPGRALKGPGARRAAALMRRAGAGSRSRAPAGSSGRHAARAAAGPGPRGRWAWCAPSWRGALRGRRRRPARWSSPALERGAAGARRRRAPPPSCTSPRSAPSGARRDLRGGERRRARARVAGRGGESGVAAARRPLSGLGVARYGRPRAAPIATSSRSWRPRSSCTAAVPRSSCSGRRTSRGRATA